MKIVYALMAFSLMFGTGFTRPIERRTELAAITQAPQPTAPDDGAALVTFGPTLEWTNPAGTTQVHLQVIPANNDGPGVNIILGSADNSFEIPPPPDWYGLLPDMTYTWRVRATDVSVSVSETDSRWGPWSTRKFITPEVSSGSLNLSSPARGSRVSGLTPVLSWTSNNPAIFYYEAQVSQDPAFGPGSFLYSALLHGGVTTPANSYAVPASFPLAAGSTYHWRVRPRVQGDGDAVSWSAASSFTTPEAGALSMQLSSPIDETEVTTPQYRVTGTLGGGIISLAGESQPFASRTNSKFMVMTVNQTLASIDASGRFSATLDLVEGPNVIDLIATDEAGDQVTSTFTVTYVPQARTQSLVLAEETPTPTSTPTPRERARERADDAKEKAKEKVREEAEEAKDKAREEREKAKEKAKARAEQERAKEKTKEKVREEVRERVREQAKARTYAGEVTEKGASSFSIKTRDGSTVSFQVNRGTQFSQTGRGKSKPTFAEVNVGMKVSVFAQGAKTVAEPTPTATPTPATTVMAETTTPGLVAKRVLLPPIKEKHAHRLGTITKIDDKSITIKDRAGKEHTGEFRDRTKKLPTGATYKEGDRVLVAAVWDDEAGIDGGWAVWMLVKLGLRPASPEGPIAPAPAAGTPTPTATATATATATTTATP